MYSPDRKVALNNAKVYKTRYKKDGTPSLQPKVLYKCAACKGEYPESDVQVDHIEPVGKEPGWPPGTGRSWDEWLTGLWSHRSNLQVLCRIDHRIKTNKDNKK